MRMVARRALSKQEHGWCVLGCLTGESREPRHMTAWLIGLQVIGDGRNLNASAINKGCTESSEQHVHICVCIPQDEKTGKMRDTGVRFKDIAGLNHILVEMREVVKMLLNDPAYAK
eukprot:scaffold70554_cov16-Tisochrysis_lutea.AAC.1